MERDAEEGIETNEYERVRVEKDGDQSEMQKEGERRRQECGEKVRTPSTRMPDCITSRSCSAHQSSENHDNGEAEKRKWKEEEEEEEEEQER
jgi:hypothetical protein